MLGYVTIEVHGEDMDGATRHAQRLANNFLEDLETMQKVSRARDRRAMSHFDTNLQEEPVPRVMHTSFNRYMPNRSIRLGSVPPSSMSTYRSTVKSVDHGLPPIIPKNYYRTYRYTADSPYYVTSSHSGRLSELSRPSSTNYSAFRHRPIVYTHTHYYPGLLNGRIYPSESYTNLSSNMKAERRRIERQLDDLMDYKLPSPEYYLNMRGSLRALNEKLDTHRRLLDRYSGIDMNANTTSVQDRIESKCQQLASRMGRRATTPNGLNFRSHGPSLNTSELETELYYQSPKTTAGYGTTLVIPDGSQTSELRGRIKRLLCRSKHDPHYYRYLPSEIR